MKILKILAFIFIMLGSTSVVYAASVEAVTKEKTFVRKYASISTASLGTIEANRQITLNGTHYDFYKVNYGGTVAYVKKSSIRIVALNEPVLTSTKAYSNAKLDAYQTLAQGTMVRVTRNLGDYLEIVRGGEIFYISKSQVLSDRIHLLAVGRMPDLEEPVEPTMVAGIVNSTLATSAVKGKDIVSSAKQFLGNPYVWGGENLETGVDCSGFVRQIFKLHNIRLEGPSYTLVNYGVSVDKDKLIPGDLVFFCNNGFSSGISHIGIYIGDRKFIHASSPSVGIIISDIDNQTYYSEAKRIIV